MLRRAQACVPPADIEIIAGDGSDSFGVSDEFLTFGTRVEIGEVDIREQDNVKIRRGDIISADFFRSVIYRFSLKVKNGTFYLFTSPNYCLYRVPDSLQTTAQDILS